MRKWLATACFLYLMVMLITGCEDKVDDPYYARPESLASPIYQNLQEKGNFTMFLKCIDKSGYADVLKSAGYYTVFAPNDAAFTSYLQENGIGSVEEMDVEKVKEIVSYSLVFNAYKKTGVDDQHSYNGIIPNKAFRRKTNKYKGVYSGTSIEYGDVKVVDINRVMEEEKIGEIPELYSADNNYKYLPVMTDTFFIGRGLTAYDYNYFFPSTEFKGFNVVDANVVTPDILAENGYIHEVDKVIEPLKNLEEMLEGRDEYSMFKEILDKYLVNYNLAPTDFSSRYNRITGNSEPIYVKSYPWLMFSPNTETFTPGSTIGEDQINCFTMFVPTNEAIQEFFNEKFLVNYGSLDNMSEVLISDFVNSHLFSSSIWPSKFEAWNTKFVDNNIIEAQVASNGFFYGTNKVQESDKFFTTFGEINLNPDYSLMLQGLKDFDLHYIIMNSNLEFTVFMVPNDVMAEYGFSYDAARKSWSYEADPSIARESLNRFLRMHIVRRKISDLSEEQMILTYGDEYIKQVDGKLYAAGNIDNEEEAIPVEKDDTPNNGVTYKFLDKPLRFSTRSPFEHLEDNPDYKWFCDYIRGNQDLYDATNKKLRDLSGGVPNTIFALSNAVVIKAIMAGDLPKTTQPTSMEDQNKVKNFFRYHFLVGKSIPYGQVQSGVYPTAYKDINGKTFVTVTSDEFGHLSLTDRSGKTVQINESKNNILSNRVVIHELNDYLNPVETIE